MIPSLRIAVRLLPFLATVSAVSDPSLISGNGLETADEPASLMEMAAEAVGQTEDKNRYATLTEKDFEAVAEEIGVEVAAIKAVVIIEAGSQMKGFWAPGVPVANFENRMFTRYKAKYPGPGSKGEKVPEGLTGYALKEWTQLVNARKSNVTAADMATFWGMFQIGGFNYKRCGCETVEEFVGLMSQSEFEQLELFVRFIVNNGMLEDLKNKNWAGFARKYNGAGYAKRGYHTRMAAAYKKFKGK